MSFPIFVGTPGGAKEAQKACPGRARAQQNMWPDGPDHWPDIYTANLIYLLEILCFLPNISNNYISYLY